MINISKVIDFLDSKFPIKLGEEWDNNGLIFGNKKRNISKILVTLDLTRTIFDKAILEQVDLIITHHPVKFYETEEEEFAKAPYKVELFDRIKNTGIGIVSLHTCYDKAKKGMWYQIAKELKVKKPQRIKGSNYGFLWEDSLNIGQVEQLLFSKLKLKKTRNNISLDSLIFKRIALIPGSGAIGDVIKAKENEAELIITSDIKWSDQITIQEMGINVLEVSHNIENIFIDHIYSILSKKFSKVLISKHIIEEIL